MRVLVKEGQSMVAEVRVGKDPVTIGSDPSSGIHLPDMRVGTHHAVILRDESADGWCIRQLSTTHRTYHNGQTLTDKAPLESHDEVQIADYVLLIYHDTARGGGEETGSSLEELAKITQFPLPDDAVIRREPERISLHREQLARLAQLTASISSGQLLRHVMDEMLKFLLDAFRADRAWLGLRSDPKGPLDVTAGLSRAGELLAEPDMLENLQHRCLTRLQRICLPSLPNSPDTQTAMAVPLLCGARVAGMVYLDRAARAGDAFSGVDLDFLMACSIVMARHLEVCRAEEDRVQSQKAGARREVALGIQSRLTPSSLPEIGLQLAAYRQDGSEGGCDLYDVLHLPNKTVAFLVATIGGDEVEAALQMAQIRGAFRVGSLHGDAPHVFMRELNWLLTAGNGQSDVDVAVVQLRPAKGTVHYCAAGDVGLVRIDEKGDCEDLAAAGSAAAGRSRDTTYETRTADLRTGDSLACFSPGVAELANTQGQSLGAERFIESLCDCFGQSASAMLSEVVSDLGAFFRRQASPRDATVFVARRP